MEGDEILAVNGCSCKDVSYERIIGLVEHAGHFLDLDVVRRAPAPPPGAGSRDRKWSYDRLDDVIASPTSLAARRRMSSPIPDYDNVFERRAVTGAKHSPFVFDRQPARPAVRDVRAAAASPPRRSNNENVSVVWNADKSITMSLALPDDVDSKENRQPAKQQQQQQPRRHRNESFLILGSPSPARVISPSPSRSLTHQVWTPRPATPPAPQHTERSAADLWLSRPTPALQPASPPASTDLSKFGPLPPAVLKIISPPSDDESLDSLSPTHLAKRKKYADSSFYDDQSQNYPTVEEQMKMARRVAQSLTAPANRNTRGQRMFMKRKEKSVDWTVDETNRRRPSVDVVSEDLYYNPAPWKATAIWKPTPHDVWTAAAVALSPIPQLFAPRVPPASSAEKAKYMSADEFERMRLFEDKSTHDTVPPQLCFNLAADLRQSASKGGRMFAKRRAKADQWTVENSPRPPVQVSKPVSSSIIPARRSTEPDYDDLAWPAGTPDLRRAAMSPWEAAAKFGYVEPAFEHLQHQKSTSIPYPPTSQHQRNQLSSTSTLLSPIRDILTSPVNGSFHINTENDGSRSRATSQGYHHHQLQQQLSDASSPWQRDVSETPSSTDAGYRPIHFSIQSPIDFIDH